MKEFIYNRKVLVMFKTDTMTTSIEQFCKILRERSTEHISAGQLLFDNGHYGQVISVLRQELDSLVRVVFLLSKDLNTRQHLINQTLRNIRWSQPNSKSIVTDRQMVELTNKLHGWTNSVYRLGCAFIHLTPMADYKNSNPFQQLTQMEINDIKQHLHNYHGFSLSESLSMETVSPFLIKVLDKVSGNLGCYIDDLENNKVGGIQSI